MNYVKSLNNLGLEMRQLPCFPGKGAPTTATEGAVGEFYMDTNTGDVYKCTAVADGVYTWERLGLSNYPDIHAEYFTITEDGVLSLKPEYRGEPVETTGLYPNCVNANNISDEGVGEAGSQNAELPEHLVIPEMVDGIAVNRIADGAFAYNMAIKSVALPKTLDAIPKDCFRRCHSLEKVTNTENVKTVGNHAFMLTNVKSVDLPNLENAVGEFAFHKCSYLTHINLGKATSIGKATFAACSSLSTIQSDDLITSVGEAAFNITHKLTNASFVKNLTYIGAGAFVGSAFDYDWSLLENCEFGRNATTLQYNSEDFWSECESTRCENPLPTLLCQHDPRWRYREIGGNHVDDRQYSSGCGLFSIIHAYCGLNYLHLPTVIEFEKIANELEPTLMGTFGWQNFLEGCQLEDVKPFAECLGLLGTEYEKFNVETVQVLYNALANGKYAVFVTSGGALGGKLGGHVVVAYGATSDGKIKFADSGAKYETDPLQGGKVYKLSPEMSCYNIVVDHDYVRDIAFCVLEKPMMVYYSTLIDAVNDVNAGTIGTNANADVSSAVAGVCMDNKGHPHVFLLKDTTEETYVAPQVDMTINLGGHTLSTSHAIAIMVTGGNLTIDGRQAGSTIKQEHETGDTCVQTSGTVESVTMLGGTYIASSSNTASVCFSLGSAKKVELVGCEIVVASDGTEGKQVTGIRTGGNTKIRSCNISVDTPNTVAVAVNISNSSNLDVQMHSCNISTTLTECTVMQLDAAKNEQNNKLSVSNTTIPEGSTINIGSDTHKLYIGKDNNFTSANTDSPSSVVVTEETYAKVK